jgi:serine/threonine protein kinase/tetratricopeptide (TPR) repeat protein
METSTGRARFGAFELDLTTGELRSVSSANGEPTVLLREQPFQVLQMLIERAGKLVTREDIKRKLWPDDTIVDFDNSINVSIRILRKAVGDTAEAPHYIETLARRGYRLMVPVEWLESAVTTPEQHPTTPATTPSLAVQSLIGKKVSHYRVIDIIGGGGMGMVYRAEDLKLSRMVALKFLPEELASDAVALQRFEREARTASALSHSNICTIHGIEEHEGQPFIVMELLEGETLRTRMAALEPKALPFDEFFGIAMQVCRGLEAAHEKGIIHRDIKPANIFLCKSGGVKILDFGLAKLAGDQVGLEKAEAADSSAPVASSSDGLKKGLTRTGTTAGTAGYMSPEQVGHEELDTRTDIFSFGLVLYEMAAGQRAFTGETVVDLHEAILHQTPVPARVRNPMLPRGFDVVFSKALEKDRQQRYQSATALRNDLSRILRAANPARRRIRQVVAAVVLLAFVALGSWRYEVYRHRITLAPTDTIVLADADNQTGDPVFNDALNIALRYEMQQTPYLNILGIDKAYATLAELKLPLTTRITSDVARRICAKTNSKMVISQSIADAGNGYHLEMRALDCVSGATLSKEQADIGSRNEVIHELGVTAVHLRGKLGEPTASLARFNQPLEKALSASLEALQAGAEGTKLHYTGDVAGALKLYQRTIELDPNLALTYEGMGNAYFFLRNFELSGASFTRAYQLRDRLTEKDRLHLEFTYYGTVIGDWEKSYSSTLRFLQIFPRDVFAHQSLASASVRLGEPNRAADEAAETARLQPSSYFFGQAIQTFRVASKFIEAKSWLAKADALKFDNLGIQLERLTVLFATGDRDGLAKFLAEAERGSNRRDILISHAYIETQQGRFRSAERLRLQALGLPSKTPDIIAPISHSALENAEVGRVVQARRDENELDKRKIDRDKKLWLALALARSGQTEEAGMLADQVSAERPEDTLVQHYLVPTIRAAIKLQQHDPAAVIDLLRGTAKYDLAYTTSFDYVYPAYIRGLAYLKLGDGRSAAAQFQKMIDNRGLTLKHVIGPLAWLQMGRAQQMMGDEGAARKSYETFLDLWKNADPDIPIYRLAKAEYAKLKKM